MPRASSRQHAFTLLEVLAAVAILALVYTVLARVGIQGFRAEGGADRRLRASLLADDTVAEIEGQIEMGSTPTIGEKEVRTMVDSASSTIEINRLQRISSVTGSSAAARVAMAVALLSTSCTMRVTPSLMGRAPSARRNARLRRPG